MAERFKTGDIVKHFKREYPDAKQRYRFEVVDTEIFPNK